MLSDTELPFGFLATQQQLLCDLEIGLAIGIPAGIETVSLLETGGDMLDQSLVPVLATKLAVAAGGGRRNDLLRRQAP